MAKKEKKEKVRYYDDGRTLADMSNVRRNYEVNKSPLVRSSFKERWNTYWNAVRLVFPTMITFITVLCVLYLVAYLFLIVFF